MTNELHGLTTLASQCDDFVVLEQVGSTNDYLREHYEANNRCIAVVTDTQTSGRGRLSRSWVTRPGESLALSVGLPWASVADARLSWLPLFVGASLVAALRGAGLVVASLKWPNDVLVGGAKLAGILCELPRPGFVIIGVGINRDFSLGEPPSPRATALAHHGDFPLAALDQILATCVGEVRAWAALDQHRGLARAHDVVTPMMGTLGRRVEVSEVDGSTWTGIAEGLDEHGHLRVTPSGSDTARVVVASDIRHLYQ